MLTNEIILRWTLRNGKLFCVNSILFMSILAKTYSKLLISMNTIFVIKVNLHFLFSNQKFHLEEEAADLSQPVLLLLDYHGKLLELGSLMLDSMKEIKGQFRHYS